MTGISGAQANHAKKQTKKASQLIWKARIAGTLKLNRFILVAFFAVKSKFEDIAFSPELNVIWAVQLMLHWQSIRTDVVGRLTNFQFESSLTH